MERLSGLDASFVYNETSSLHMHTLKYTVLDVSGVDGGFTVDKLRHELGAPAAPAAAVPAPAGRGAAGSAPPGVDRGPRLRPRRARPPRRRPRPRRAARDGRPGRRDRLLAARPAAAAVGVLDPRRPRRRPRRPGRLTAERAQGRLPGEDAPRAGRRRGRGGAAGQRLRDRGPRRRPAAADPSVATRAHAVRLAARPGRAPRRQAQPAAAALAGRADLLRAARGVAGTARSPRSPRRGRSWTPRGRRSTAR